MGFIKWLNDQKKSYEEEQQKQKDAYAAGMQKLKDIAKKAKEKDKALVENYTQQEQKKKEEAQKQAVKDNKAIEAANKTISAVNNALDTQAKVYKKLGAIDPKYKAMGEKLENSKFSMLEKKNENPMTYYEQLMGGDMVMSLFPEMQSGPIYDNTVKKLAERDKYQTFIDSGFDDIAQDESFHEYAAQGEKKVGKLQYNDQMYTDWGGVVDSRVYAFDNLPEEELKKVYAVAGKYGMNSKEYDLALQVALYEGGQGYENKKAEEISYDNDSLIKYGYRAGLKQSGEGLQVSFNVLTGNSYVPRIKSAQDIAFERDLAEAPTSVQLATMGTMGLGQVSSMFAVGLLTGNPALATAFMGFGSAGNAYEESRAEGKRHEESLQYATMVGVSEIALTQALGVFKYVSKAGLKALNPNLSTAISKSARSPKITSLLGYLKANLREGLEEYTQEILNPAFRNAAFGENNKMKLFTPQALVAGIAGFLIGGVANLSGLDINISKLKNIKTYVMNLTQDMNIDELGIFYNAQKSVKQTIEEFRQTKAKANGSAAAKASTLSQAPEGETKAATQAQETQSDAKTETPEQMSGDGIKAKETVSISENETETKSDLPTQNASGETEARNLRENAGDTQTEQEAQNSTDKRFEGFINRTKENINTDEKYSFSTVDDQAGAEIKKTTGIDVTGYSNTIGTREAAGISEKISDIQIKDVLSNYTDVRSQQQTDITDQEGNAQSVLVFTKQVGDGYQVVKAVLDAKSKELKIIEAYKSDVKDGGPQRNDVIQTAEGIKEAVKSDDETDLVGSKESEQNLANDEDMGYKEGEEDVIEGIKMIRGKVGGKIPVDIFKATRRSSIKNPDADTMVLGRFSNDENSYIAKAQKSGAMYFDMGDGWSAIQEEYDLTDEEMFHYFNVPALDDAIASGKHIKFSHNPLDYQSGALVDEWNYFKKVLRLNDDYLKGDVFV
jgi:hypothetical protein